MKIRMKFKKATKNTFVFEEILEDGQVADPAMAKIPTLYVRKSALEGPAQIISVTVEVEDGA
jgi:hypothetical protein